MVLFLGPLYNGKHAAAEAWAAERGKDLRDLVLLDDVPSRFFKTPETFRPEALEALADEYEKADIVLLTEVGSGLVPVDPEDRASRETAGRFGVLLAERADEVYRVFCGIPKRLK